MSIPGISLIPGRENKAHAIIHSSATSAAAVGLATAQVPGDRFIIGGVQIMMIIQIASLFGVRLTESAAAAIFESQIASLIGVELANQLLKYIPGAGNLVNAGVAFSITETIGWATYHHFERTNG